MQYPTEIQTGMTLPTLGTMMPQQFEMDGVVPKSYLQNVNIEKQGVAGQALALGFDTPMFQSTLEEYESSARAKDMNELTQQRIAGVDPKTAYFGFANTSSNPTNYNWSSRPMANLGLSSNTVPFKYADSWSNQNPSRSEARTTMGRKIIDQNTALRSVRLY